MHKHIILFFITFTVFAGCSNKSGEKNLIITKENISGRSIEIVFKKGESWSEKIKFGVASFTITPQIAVWIEDKDGKYIDTLYVTRSFGKQRWGLYGDENKTFRTSSLPYWMNKRLQAGLKSPTKKSPLADSETGATPKADFTIESKIKKEVSEFRILAEVNKSFDVNKNFHVDEKGYTDGVINGQPSVVYQADIDLIKPGSDYSMKLIGRGGENGEDGRLYNDLEKLTTAKNILKSITVHIQ
jgi:hypothetical protein